MALCARPFSAVLLGRDCDHQPDGSGFPSGLCGGRSDTSGTTTHDYACPPQTQGCLLGTRGPCGVGGGGKRAGVRPSPPPARPVGAQTQVGTVAEGPRARTLLPGRSNQQPLRSGRLRLLSLPLSPPVRARARARAPLAAEVVATKLGPRLAGPGVRARRGGGRERRGGAERRRLRRV